MRRIVALFTLIFALSGIAFAQMTDDQVVQYVKEAHKMGRSQSQITTELLRRGVTQEQVERIKKKYEEQQAGGEQTSMQGDTQSRKRTGESSTSRKKKNAKKGPSQITPNRRSNSASENLEYYDEELEMMEEEEEFFEYEEEQTIKIYGHDIFTNENLTFEPNINLATPENYRLGPGDEVIIDVWGASETTIRQTISPEGVIMVNNVGPVYLSGKTVKEANRYLKDQFARIYAGIMSNEPTTQVKLTLGEIRSIQVNVMGEVNVPGTYTLSSFASVFHALYQAGGVNDIGSLRSIKVIRNGKVIADLDVYEFLMNGKMNDNTRLQDNDVVLVDPYQSLVEISGKVKRPMFYELKPTETAESLLKYSGGFTGDAYKKALRVIRKSGREYQIYNVDEQDYASFIMDDGDVASVDSVMPRYENRVEIRGAIYRPGLYQVDNAGTVKTLIEKAEGLRGDAFLNRAILEREREDLTYEVISLDIRGIMGGTADDVLLQKNDVIYIPSIHDLMEAQTISINGEIAKPGMYAYSEYMTVEDLIVQAGGLLESAATTRIEVIRRIKDPSSTEFSTTIGETFTFDINENFTINGTGDEFYLEPFDEIYVRKSPAYYKQQNVTIGGEVLFSGVYALSKKNERLSDLVSKAGGVTPDAFIKGARLVRKMTADELARREATLKLSKTTASEEGDSISTERLDLSDTYSVGINLAEALNHPGSDADVVLREGDNLFIPEYVSTVKISGAVMYPNTVTFRAGESIKEYVEQAGGYADDANKGKPYVIYMNGTVAQGKKSEIQPGCEIVIPSKEKKDKMSTAEIISIGTSVASLATMIATIVNLVK